MNPRYPKDDDLEHLPGAVRGLRSSWTGRRRDSGFLGEPIMPRAMRLLLCAALLCGADSMASARPEYVVLLHDISDGHHVILCGETLDDPLPPPGQVTPLDRILDDGEDGEGIVIIETGSKDFRFPVTSDDGRFCLDPPLEPPLDPGVYSIMWQSTSGQQAFSPARLRVLSPDYTGRVVVSDIDLTYLQTDFQSASSMARLVREDATEKQPLVGMPELYRGILAHGDTPLVFMSGSPGFFRPTLEARLALDGIRHDALILKPYGAIVKRRLKRGCVRGLVSALKEQVAYKLERLIDLHLHLPAGCGYVLLGDNSESDYVVYPVFRDLLGGDLAPETLFTRLVEQGVDEETATRIMGAAKHLVRRQGDRKVPVDIYIRRVDPAKPLGMDPNIRWHFDSYQLALGLFEQDAISKRDVRRVAAALGEGWTGDQARARSARWALEQGLITRDQMYTLVTEKELAAIERNEDWETWFEAPPTPTPPLEED